MCRAPRCRPAEGAPFVPIAQRGAKVQNLLAFFFTSPYPKEWLWHRHINPIYLSCQKESFSVEFQWQHTQRFWVSTQSTNGWLGSKSLGFYFSKMRENTAVFPELSCISPKYTKKSLATQHILSCLPLGTQQKKCCLLRLSFQYSLLRTSQQKPISRILWSISCCMGTSR